MECEAGNRRMQQDHHGAQGVIAHYGIILGLRTLALCNLAHGILNSPRCLSSQFCIQCPIRDHAMEDSARHDASGVKKSQSLLIDIQVLSPCWTLIFEYRYPCTLIQRRLCIILQLRHLTSLLQSLSQDLVPAMRHALPLVPLVSPLFPSTAWNLGSLKSTLARCQCQAGT